MAFLTVSKGCPYYRGPSVPGESAFYGINVSEHLLSDKMAAGVASQTFLGPGPGEATVLGMSATHHGVSFFSF